MLTITPINNAYYNTSVSFKGNLKTVESVDYSKIHEALEKITIETQAVIPLEKKPQKSFFIKIKDFGTKLFSCLRKLETLPAVDKDGNTELSYICIEGDFEKFSSFIKEHPNFDPNQRDYYGRSYIWLSAIFKRNDYISILNALAANKNLNLEKTDHAGFDDLHNLCCHGPIEAVKTLVKNHPDFNPSKLTHVAPPSSYIDIAKMHGHYDIADYLTKLKQKKIISVAC